MTIRAITPEDKVAFNAVATHPLQSYEWGEFREKAGVKVVRQGLFEGQKLADALQVTIHKIPHTPWSIGYFPKGNMPTTEVTQELQNIGRKEKCLFIQLEPSIIRSTNHESGIMNEQEKKQFETIIHNSKFIIQPSAHPLFTKYTFVLDLTPTEEDLLKNMYSKTRYNIRVAQKHGVKVVEDNSDEAFQEYLRLTDETTKRQGFFAHMPTYHKVQWQTLPHTYTDNQLSSHLLIARYKEKVLTAWIMFVFKDTLYYPYGASSSEHREVMASNLMMWEAIRWGKNLGLKKFDMWGSLGPDANPEDPWYGFHRFKQGYGSALTEFVGSYDLVINSLLYQGYKVADKLRWFILRLKK